jgi:hypothetical protein
VKASKLERQRMKMDRSNEPDKLFYEIQVRGCLDECWGEFFDGMTLASDGEITTISGVVADQSALHGLLERVRDFGLVLLSVNSAEGERKFF